MSWLGLDIGGANLKAANATDWAHSVPYALWRDPDGLAAALTALIALAPAADEFAVTMTGELCDCFRTKADGVRHIIAVINAVAGRRAVSVYLTDGRFASIAEALESPSLAAASNWRALAEFSCRYTLGGVALLVDVGSTTTDIIPIVDGCVAARGRHDTERLATGELVYSGVGRTPLCAITRSLPWQGILCPVAAELFSTTADAYLLLSQISEDSTATWTADGRALTFECARQRLARQICADAADLTPEEFNLMASFVRNSQLATLTTGMAASSRALPRPPDVIVVSGWGEFLARAAAKEVFPECQVFSLSGSLGATTSRCATAHALAVLATSGGYTIGPEAGPS
jgi:(4-(4-[2-(gamma-L-glutamylamino)ethyl]phenoxymethyl)furan-2-yl)methanamine synthase